jgi:exodeoxyribonuclease VII small subunit
MTSNREAIHFNFEKSLDELEELIAQSENGEIDLNSMVANYQTGMSLIKSCRAELEKAELQVKMSEDSGLSPTKNA